MRIASLIIHMLFSYLRMQNAHLIAFRVSAVQLFADGETTWPILEWIEDSCREGVAIFHFDGEPEPQECSWLMHSEFPKGQNSRVDWNVATVSHLKTLFMVAQRVLQLVQIQEADDGCDPEATCHSFEE